MSAGMEKGIKDSQDQSSIILLFENNLGHNAVVLTVTLKSIMLKFSSIMYLTLCRVLRGQLFHPKGKFNYLVVCFTQCTLFCQ